jgi:hypothetical protein
VFSVSGQDSTAQRVGLERDLNPRFRQRSYSGWVIRNPTTVTSKEQGVSNGRLCMKIFLRKFIRT